MYIYYIQYLLGSITAPVVLGKLERTVSARADFEESIVDEQNDSGSCLVKDVKTIRYVA